MQTLRRHALRAIPVLAVLLVAAGFIFGGVRLSQHEPAQITFYNRAMAAYEDGDIEAAMQLLDQSLSAYDGAKNSPWHQRAWSGQPSDEIAAQAHFHKGMLLLIQAQLEERPGLVGQAVEELEASLRINPGAPYASHVLPRDAARLNEEALVVKHNLDLLFQKHPEQQGAEGDGDGQGDGPPKPAEPAPGDSPSDKPGHGSDDGI